MFAINTRSANTIVFLLTARGASRAFFLERVATPSAAGMEIGVVSTGHLVRNGRQETYTHTTRIDELVYFLEKWYLNLLGIRRIPDADNVIIVTKVLCLKMER